MQNLINIQQIPEKIQKDLSQQNIEFNKKDQSIKNTQIHSYSEKIIISKCNIDLNDIGRPQISINEIPVQESLSEEIQVYFLFTQGNYQVSLEKGNKKQDRNSLQEDDKLNEDQMRMRNLYHKYLIEKYKQEDHKKNEAIQIKAKRRLLDFYYNFDDDQKEKSKSKCCGIF